MDILSARFKHGDGARLLWDPGRVMYAWHMIGRHRLIAKLSHQRDAHQTCSLEVR